MIVCISFRCDNDVIKYNTSEGENIMRVLEKSELEQIIGGSLGARSSNKRHNTCDHEFVRTGKEDECWRFWIWDTIMEEFKCTKCGYSEWRDK